MITERDNQFGAWKQKPVFPHLKERETHYAQTFIERLQGQDFPVPLWKHQMEAVLNVIYRGEVEGRWDSLLEVVTGGGKTVIMSAIMAYLWQVRRIEKILILTPNTIVRERVKDDFDVKAPDFAFKRFPFFFNSFVDVPLTRLSTVVLRGAEDTAGIKDANIIVANIHQLYEGRSSQALEVLRSAITPELAIFNDEAHNAAAREYREVLKLLKEKTACRVDLTATPYRLDKEDLDTFPPVYCYQVKEATVDGVVKQIVVTKPDIETVKLQYEEWDDKDQVVRVLDVQEMPWEQIEQDLRRGGAVKFVTAKNARRQQLQIAQSCLQYQRKCVTRDPKGNLLWEPLLLVVALSQNDAKLVLEALQKEPFNYKREELLLVHSKQDEAENNKAFLLGRRTSEGLNEEAKKLWNETRRVRVIIAVSMLREGWDVRNIAVICLFRKFSYQMKGDRIYTVYGPQIIGRGLRRIRTNPRELDPLFVVDHPAFDHDWLWREIFSAREYGKMIKPGEDIEDEQMGQTTLPITDLSDEEKNAGNKPPQVNEQQVADWIAGLPPALSITPIADWQKHFRELNMEKRIGSAFQQITNVKSMKLGSDNTAHVLPDAEINVEELNNPQGSGTDTMSREDLVHEITHELSNEPHQVLMALTKQETAEQLKLLNDALLWILRERFNVQGFGDIEQADNAILNKLHFCLPQIFDELRDPAVLMGILGAQV